MCEQQCERDRGSSVLVIVIWDLVYIEKNDYQKRLNFYVLKKSQQFRAITSLTRFYYNKCFLVFSKIRGKHVS